MTPSASLVAGLGGEPAGGADQVGDRRLALARSASLLGVADVVGDLLVGVGFGGGAGAAFGLGQGQLRLADAGVPALQRFGREDRRVGAAGQAGLVDRDAGGAEVVRRAGGDPAAARCCSALSKR